MNPHEVIGVVQIFLTCEDYHYFSNASKRISQQIKKQTIYYPLKQFESLLFFENERSSYSVIII